MQRPSGLFGEFQVADPEWGRAIKRMAVMWGKVSRALVTQGLIGPVRKLRLSTLDWDVECREHNQEGDMESKRDRGAGGACLESRKP